jgi:hypothetical protein
VLKLILEYHTFFSIFTSYYRRWIMNYAGTPPQGFVYRDNYPCEEIPVRKNL